MKRYLKSLFYLLLLFLFLFTGFYFWASSPNLSREEYAIIESSDPAAAPSNDSVFSVLTYNIGYLSGMTNNLPVEKPRSLYEKNLLKVLAELKAVNADILAFQEIDYHSKRSYFINQQSEIAELAYPFAGKCINWDKRYVPFPYYPFSMHFGQMLSGQSVLSKYPILEQERIELVRNVSQPFYSDRFYLDRLAQVVRLRLGKQMLVLINVHLEAFDKDTRLQQTRRVRELYLKYYKEFPTILLGDFNSDPEELDPSIQLILDLPKTGNAAFGNAGKEKTYSSREPTKRLDYIFYNTEFIQELGGKVLREFQEASDHLPVLMQFKFKNR